jgi:hypothetical protein
MRESIPLLIAVVLSLASPSVAAQYAPRKALATKSSALYESPQTVLLPRLFLQQGDTFTVDTQFTDSSGSVWHGVARTEGRLWLRGVDLQYLGEHDSVSSSPGAPTNDQDRKRRYQLARENPQWPRRIIAAVREGRVCLDMTAEQLTASWGNPMEKGKSFTLGIGEHDTWVYRGTRDRILFVSLYAGRVIGWYPEKP